MILDFLNETRVLVRRTTFETNPTLISKLHWADRANLPKIYLLERSKADAELFDFTLLKSLRPDVDLDEMERFGVDPRSKLIWMIGKLIEGEQDQPVENEIAQIEEAVNDNNESALEKYSNSSSIVPWL